MKKLVTLCASVFLSCSAMAQMRITEWEYNGSANAEFIEFTNVGNTAISMTNWSFDDDSRNAGTVSLSAFGMVQPGESVILCETSASNFRSAWGLCAGIKIIGNNAANLGRADEINLYDGSGTLVDRLTYNDQAANGSPTKGPRTDGKSAWVPAAGLGANNASLWTFSALNDTEGSFASAGGDLGSPGKSTRATVLYNPCPPANSAPTIAMDVTNTTNFLDGGVAVSPSSPYNISGVISDPTDPAATLGLHFTLADPNTPVANLTVTVASSNALVVPLANITVTGTAASRNIRIVPANVGYANITLTVNDGSLSSSYILSYAASAAAATPSATQWHTGISDASAAMALDDNYYIAADDELNLLNVYSRSASGLPLKSYEYTSSLSLPNPGSPEADVEASTRSIANGNKIYWLGSMSNGKGPSFDDKPNRNRLFATTVSGTGSLTAFSFSGYYGNLRSRLISWGDANGYNFTASAASGVDSKAINGLAAEGLVFGPDNTTLYIGLRAPLVPTANRTKAVIAPILNFESWFNNGSPAGNPTFGPPIELNLGNRGIRDLIRLSNGTYIIIAGNYAGSPVTGAIYKWSGYAADAPVLVSSPASNALAMESAMQVNVGGQPSLSQLQVITDMGDDVFYNDGTAAKDLDLNLRKFRCDNLSSLNLCQVSPTITASGSTTLCAGGSVTLAATPGMSLYLWSNGATTPSIVVSSTGNYSVAVTHSSGCTGTSAITSVSVRTVPAASITASGSNDFCVGTTRKLTATAGMNTYSWSTGANTQTLNISATGVYSVSMTYTNGCSSSASIAMQAHNNILNAGVIGSDQYNCGPYQPAQINSLANATADPGETIYYQWLKSPVNILNTPGNPYWQAIPGATLAAFQPADSISQNTFYVRCGKTQYCTFLGYTTETNIVGAYVNTVPTASINASGSTTFCAGTSVTLSAGTSTGVSSYTWSTGAPTSSIVVSATGNYSVTVTHSNGCTGFSALTSVSVTPASNSTATVKACEHYTWNGTTYTTSGVYTYSTQNAVGCDSIASLNLVINNNSSSSTSVTACNNYAWNGNTYTISGVYTYTTQNAAGCDSIASLDLTIHNSSSSSTSITACKSYTWNNTTYTSSGVYTYTTQNAAGCDSVATLDLNIMNLLTYTVSQGACDEYTWHGTTYTTSGVYTYSVENQAGCDTLAILSLTIHSSPVALINPADTLIFCPLNPVILSANAGMSAYLWSNGATTQTISTAASGNYTIQITDANGCTGTSAQAVVLINVSQADFNGDGTVNTDDFMLFTPKFNTACNCAQDLNQSGFVDIDDFLLFAPRFGLSCQ